MGVDPKLVHQEPNEPVVEQEREVLRQILEEVPEVEAQNVPEIEVLRRSTRHKKSVISTDYKVYNTKIVHTEKDPTSYEEAIRSPHSSKWMKEMEDDMKSMSSKDVWDLEEIPKGAKTVGCKWLYKIMYDSKGNVEKYKA